MLISEDKMPAEEFKSLEKTFQGIDLFIERGKFYLKQGDFNLAKEEFKKAIEINPNHDIAHFEMGNTALRMKDDLGAEEEYKKALDLNSHLFYATLELGKLYHYRMKRTDLAIAEFNHAIFECPQHWEAHYELGIIYKEKGEFDKAIKSLRKASDANQESERAHFEIGKLYRDMDNPDEAIKEFERVLSIGDNSNDAFIKNKVLNEIEITQRKIILESKVRAMVAMILNKCNLSCIMCHIWESPWQASSKTMDEIVSLFPYIEDMVWEGGEVLLMKDFDDILKEASRHRHLKQVLFTNGLILNEKIIERVINGRIDLVFSIDGVTKDTYEHIRRGGKFEHLTRNLSLIRQAKQAAGGKIETYFNSIIMKSNCQEIEKFIDFAKEYNFNAITLTPIRGDYGEENIFDNNDKKALGYIKKAIPRVTKKAYEYGVILNNWLPGMQVSDNEFKGCSGEVVKEKICGNSTVCQKNKIICHAPWQRLVLDSEGQVRPFVFCMNKWIGNSDKSSLHDIWNGEAMQEYRKKIINCDYYGLCQPECISGQVADKIRDII
jgi:MoaA/NifB/PqqE/SkfB family radical SAM enzyme/Tfp pilus assembly protein PilF